MAYKCPRCGEPVQRGTSSSAAMSAGLVGAMFYAAFGSFQCKNCGKLRRSEFPVEDRSSMLFGSFALIFGAVLLVALVLWLVVSLE
jgi:DNA-directed RNA polymerase subunit RPC12/RpoP